MFLYICEGFKFYCVKVCRMYSKEFMRFLYEYQKDEFKPKTPEQKIIRFKNNRSGKLAEVLLTEKSE